MYPQELLLLLLTGISIIGTPMYIFFRKEMINKPTGNGFHPWRVFKVTTINSILCVITYAIFLFMLIFVIYKQGFNLSLEVIVLSVIFLIIISLTLYGNGMYVSAIVIEAFTQPELRKQKSFKTQFIATDLFHGPISHIIIYSGYVIALFLLSIIELLIENKASIPPIVMIICGIIAGMIYCITQNFNGTIRFQFRTSLATLCLFMFFYVSRSLESMFDYSLTTFFIFFSITFIAASLMYYTFEKKTKNKKDMQWYKYLEY